MKKLVFFIVCIVCMTIGEIKLSAQVINPMSFERFSRDQPLSPAVISTKDSSTLSDKDHKTPLNTTYVSTPSYDVSIFGNGGLKNAVMNSSNSNIPLNGSIGVTILSQKLLQTTIGYTVNDFQTLKINSPESFGKNMLTPDVNGQSFTVNLRQYFLGFFSDTRRSDQKSKFMKNSGAEFLFILANADWNVHDSTSYRASTISTNLNWIFEPFGIIKKGNNRIVVEAALGITLRAVLGDITNYSDERKTYLGTTQTCFWGPEIDMRLSINDQTVFINVPYIFSKDNISGLTGVQIIIGITLSGNIIKLSD